MIGSLSVSAILFLLLALVPSVILHEVSHGLVADLCGDPTAREAGRLTLNPLKHVDPFGSVVLPAILLFMGLPMFGYAKPVPYNPNRLRHPRNQSLLVGLVGPFTNFLLVAVAIVVSHAANYHAVEVGGSVYLNTSSWFAQYLVYFGTINLVLGIFNLLPIPPLDGSSIIARFVPARRLRRYYELSRYGFIVVFALLLLVNYGHINIDPFTLFVKLLNL